MSHRDSFNSLWHWFSLKSLELDKRAENTFLPRDFWCFDDGDGEYCLTRHSEGVGDQFGWYLLSVKDIASNSPTFFCSSDLSLMRCWGSAFVCKTCTALPLIGCMRFCFFWVYGLEYHNLSQLRPRNPNCNFFLLILKCHLDYKQTWSSLLLSPFAPFKTQRCF